MTVRKLISKFNNNRMMVDICTPAFRKTSTLRDLILENDKVILDSKVESWQVTLAGILMIDV